jgi:TRAP-type transport system periplasmic protein
MTNHMWSGFNQMAHGPTWSKLPADIRTVIDRNVTRSVRLQRADQERANSTLRPELEKRGLVFNDIDPAPFRKQLSGFYAKWKDRLGSKCWSLLEETTGRLT